MTTVNEIGEIDTHATFDVRDPGTGDVVGTYPIHTEADIEAAVARARTAYAWWSALGYAERAGAWPDSRDCWPGGCGSWPR